MELTLKTEALSIGKQDKRDNRQHFCTPLTAEVCCKYSNIQAVKSLPIMPGLCSKLACYANIFGMPIVPKIMPT